MSILLFIAPNEAIPPLGTNARKYLDLLALGEVKESEAMLLFNGNQRSPIQDLGADRYCNWLIKPIENEQGVIVARKLDERHFSGDKQLDADARTERKRILKDRSHKQAKQGRIREPKAFKELTEAQREFFLSLGVAANDEQKNTAKKS
ncbi:hypothetical protein [Colwellia sp. RSH04]|uniref:hypothetical protein n=1 Tax=Colwellia sp. RSH04 TaxID=2305464 RepID=UPI000E575B59|nr:hypothetical protein [Colwellia sp. RSH04]RHW76803.1 hypothetical protein D1094_06885 [Colwellia sp. RSH04]